MTELSEPERKYHVFVSSTFRDLAEQRRMVVDTVVERGHMPIALDRFPAADASVHLVINKAIQETQIYVVILGCWYGSIVNGQNISYSELEYVRALDEEKLVLPFLLHDDEVREGRKALRDRLDQSQRRVTHFAANSPERNELEIEIAQLEAELNNEALLWAFRQKAGGSRYPQYFSLSGGVEAKVPRFDKHMVLTALLKAEKDAVEKGTPGWIREPKEHKLAKTIQDISENKFLMDVVGAMGEFGSVKPRVNDHVEEKAAAASFFADRYLQPLLDKQANVFFESGSTVAYVAEVLGRQLKESRKELKISTNNVLAYLVFWLVRRLECSLFPWGSPEELYAAVFGRAIDDNVPKERTPHFPPDELSSSDYRAIELLKKDPFSPAQWSGPTLLLGALSGLQLKEDPNIASCLGPHVGSPRNKVFKRFMYSTGHPLMLFMTADKINCAVDQTKCHFIVGDQDMKWEVFFKEYPLAFCVGCPKPEIDTAIAHFTHLGFDVIRPRHLTSHTAFIARNTKFRTALEKAGIEDS